MLVAALTASLALTGAEKTREEQLIESRNKVKFMQHHHFTSALKQMVPEEFAEHDLLFVDQGAASKKNLRALASGPDNGPHLDLGPGYVFIKGYTDPMCRDDSMRGIFGFAHDTCFGARKKHNTQVEGSYKYKVVPNDKGRATVEVRVFKSADCTGEAKLSKSHLNRLNVEGNTPYRTSKWHSNPRYWGVEHDDETGMKHKPIECFKADFEPGASWPKQQACFPNAMSIARGETAGCANDQAMFFMAMDASDLFGQCDNGMTVQCKETTTGSQLDYTMFGTINGQGSPNNAPWDQYGNYNSDFRMDLQCAAGNEAYSGSVPLGLCSEVHQGDDDYQGRPLSKKRHDDDYGEGWDNPKSEDYDPMGSLLFHPDYRKNLEQSTLNVKQNCWTNMPSTCQH